MSFFNSLQSAFVGNNPVANPSTNNAPSLINEIGSFVGEGLSIVKDAFLSGLKDKVSPVTTRQTVYVPQSPSTQQQSTQSTSTESIPNRVFTTGSPISMILISGVGVLLILLFIRKK